MNGPHDVGGMMGFGPINPEADEPVFHGRWEERVLGMTLCAGSAGGWNIDESRHIRENRHPADYYSSTYYELWLKGLEQLLVRHSLVTSAEIDAGQSSAPGPEGVRVLRAEAVPKVLSSGGPTERPATTEARFGVGDAVVARDMHPSGHTRLPRYVRGRVGTVESIHGCHVYPDTNAHGQGEQPEWLYTVRFEGTELWGPDAEAGLSVSVDAWEPYLQAAGAI